MKMRYFSTACDVAKMSDYKQQIGCVLIYKGKILGTGFNCSKTHPIQKIYNKERFPEEDVLHTLHAETHAISPFLHKEGIDWSKVIVYTYRIKKSKPYGMSRPCPSCMAMLKNLGVRKICYSTEDGFAEEHI